jgi:hypothetical protein
VQQGQVFDLRRYASDGELLWAFRYEPVAATRSGCSVAGSPASRTPGCARPWPRSSVIGKLGELTSQEIAAWRMDLSPGYRFEATQALRQVLHRAVALEPALVAAAEG